MKILFLDIDGVLNSVRSSVAFDGYPNFKNIDKMDKIAVNLIKKVCIKTGSVICLSSTWRHYVDLLLFSKEIDLPIISKTSRKLTATRGEEIAMWLRDNKDIEKYAIVDDDSELLIEQIPYFVKVDFYDGLSYDNYVNLLRILTTQ